MGMAAEQMESGFALLERFRAAVLFDAAVRGGIRG
jgi:hypothetical protein